MPMKLVKEAGGVVGGARGLDSLGVLQTGAPTTPVSREVPEGVASGAVFGSEGGAPEGVEAIRPGDASNSSPLRVCEKTLGLWSYFIPRQGWKLG